MSDWKPHLYLEFEKQRTQPSIDLVARIGHDAPKRIIDIGCGPGNSTHILKRRWPEAEIIGLDASHAMLKQAREKFDGIQWVQADASGDLTGLGLFDIVFSNAAIQWMPDHPILLENLFSLVGNGVLAVQVPCTKHMPVHTELQKLTETPNWYAHFTHLSSAHTDFEAPYYYDILSGLSPDIDVWETDYIHVMNNHEAIVRWYSGSGLRPYLDRLDDEALKSAFLSEYEVLLKEAYPLQADKKVLFPFRRIFFTAKK